MAISAEDFLDSNVQPARLMSYGPIEGEYHHSAMYGPAGNALGPEDVAASPDYGFPMGGIVDIGDNKLRRVADASYLHPNQPTSHTIELRDRHDMGHGMVKLVDANQFLDSGTTADQFLGTSPAAQPGVDTERKVPYYLDKARADIPTPTLAVPEGAPGYSENLSEAYKRLHPQEFATLPADEIVRQSIMAPNKEVPFHTAGERPVEIPREVTPTADPGSGGFLQWKDQPLMHNLTPEEEAQYKSMGIPVDSGQGYGPARTALREEAMGFSSPQNIALLSLAPGSKLVKQYFLATMASQLPDAYRAYRDAVTPEEATQALVHGAVALGFTALLGKGELKGKEIRPYEQPGQRGFQMVGEGKISPGDQVERAASEAGKTGQWKLPDGRVVGYRSQPNEAEAKMNADYQAERAQPQQTFELQARVQELVDQGMPEDMAFAKAHAEIVQPRPQPIEAAPQEPAEMNIGQEVTGQGKVHDTDKIKAAVQEVAPDVKVTVAQDVTGTEPTTLIRTDRRLTATEGKALAKSLQQDAIFQHSDSGKVDTFGPNKGEYNWDPQYFKTLDEKGNEIKLSDKTAPEGTVEEAAPEVKEPAQVAAAIEPKGTETAKERLQSDPELGDHLADRVLDPNTPTTLDQADQEVLFEHANNLESRIEKLRNDINATQDPEKSARLEKYKSQLDKAQAALDATGSALGGSLGSRAGQPRNIANYSRDRLKSHAKSELGGKLSPKAEKKVDTIFDKLDQVNEKLKTRKAKVESGGRGVKLPKTRKGLVEMVDKLAEGSEDILRKELKKYTNIGIIPQNPNVRVIIDHASRLVMKHMVHGAIDVAEATRKVLRQFGEGVKPFMDQIMDKARDLDKLWAGQGRFFTDEALAASKGQSQKEVMRLFKGLDPKQTIRDAKAGGYLKDWYPKFWQQILDWFPNDADAIRFSKLFGTYGANNGPVENTIRALHTWNEWEKSGRPHDVPTLRNLVEDVVYVGEGKKDFNKIMAWGNNIVRALSVPDSEVHQVRLSGPKVDPYSMNIGGNLDRATLDRHMATPMMEQLKEKGAAGATSAYFGLSKAQGKGEKVKSGLGVRGRAYDAHLRMVAEQMNKLNLKKAFIGRDDKFWGIEDAEDGARFKKTGHSAVECTGYSCAVQSMLGNDRVKVFGFFAKDNPGSRIARQAGGHDFAVVDGRYIVDPWVKDVENMSKKGVFDMQLDAAEIKKLYGDQGKWDKVPDQPHEKPTMELQPWETGNVQAGVWGQVQPLKVLAKELSGGGRAGGPDYEKIYADLRSGKRKLSNDEKARLSELRAQLQPERITSNPEIQRLVRELGRGREARYRNETPEDFAKSQGKTIFDRFREIVEPLDRAAEQATADLAARGPEFASGAALSPEAFKRGAIIAARDIVHTGIDFAEWSTKMVKSLGDGIKPHLQKMWDEANRILKEYGAIADERRRKAWVKRNLRSIKEMTTAMAKGDTSPLHPTRLPIEYDPVMNRLEAAKHSVLREYQGFLEKERGKQKGKIGKFLDISREVRQLPRSIQTSIDQSYLKNQGGMALAAHPKMTAKVMKNTMKAVTEKGYEEVQHEIRTGPNAYRHRRSGLAETDVYGERTKREELFLGKWGTKIPGVKQSGQLMTAFLNKTRSDWWDLMADRFEQDGRKLSLPEEKYISNFVNIATGRAKFQNHKLEGLMQGLSDYAFAARWRASRLQTLLGQPIWSQAGSGKVRARLRAAVAYDMAKGVGVTVAARYMLKAAIGAGVFGLAMQKANEKSTDDPRSADFFQIFVPDEDGSGGETTVDLSSGLRTNAVFMSRLVDEAIASFRNKKPVMPVDQAVGSYMRSGLAPNIKNIYDYLKQQDYDRQKPNLWTMAKGQLPMSPVDMTQAFEHQGFGHAIATSLAAWFGVNVNRRDQKQLSTRGGAWGR